MDELIEDIFYAFRDSLESLPRGLSEHELHQLIQVRFFEGIIAACHKHGFYSKYCKKNESGGRR